ncbi:hypothetical protein EH228_06645 [Erwinia endophytica]|nr:hypothetical protein EH228_06645 [Erwinia endophytica]
MKQVQRSILFIAVISCVFPVLAIDCDKASSIVENTICDTPQLFWLDGLLNETYRKTMMAEETNSAVQRMQLWQRSRDACTTNRCLRWAYLQGLSELYHVPETFSWNGVWWNTSATNGNGGKITISNANEWAFDFTGQVWSGVYKSTLRGNVRIYKGQGFTDRIAWGGKCTVLFIPRQDGKLEINSDKMGSCKLLMPGNMSIDGEYEKAVSDPRPAATLLSLGVFPSQTLDDRFRQLADKDYQQYVRVANNVRYVEDQDDMGATVLILSLKGAANRYAAIVMYTSTGKIWAMLVTPDDSQENSIQLSYITTEKGETTLPKTLTNWRNLFLN